MNLLTSWKNSLSIFYPLNNLKLFGFAILRAIQVAVPQFFKMFWWVLPGFFLVIAYNGRGVGVLAFVSFVLSLFFSFFSLFPFSMVLYLFLRPSVSKKGLSYFLSYSRHMLIVTFFFLLIPVSYVLVLFMYGTATAIQESPFAFIEMIYRVWLSYPKDFYSLAVYGKIFFAIFPSIISVWYFFFFDSSGRMKDVFLSIKNAVRMCFLSFPAWCLIFLVQYWVNFGVSRISFILSSQTPSFKEAFFYCLSFLIVFIFDLLIAAIWSVFYTKRLHEQFELYFPGPQIKKS
jgi:hypothetical protein